MATDETRSPPDIPPPPPGSDIDLWADGDVVTVRFHAPPLPGWVVPILQVGFVLFCGCSVLMVVLPAGPWLRRDDWLPVLYVNGLLGAALLVAGASKAFLRPQPQRLTLRVDGERLSLHEPWRLEGARGSWAMRDVLDVTLTVAAQVLAEAPQMELCLHLASRPPLFVLAGTAPRELMWLEGLLRRLLGLASRRDGRVQWLRPQSPEPQAPAATAPLAISAAAPTAVAVLPYATPRARARALDPFMRVLGNRLAVAFDPPVSAAPATLTLTPDELTLEDGTGERRWRCDDVYAVFTSFAVEGEPPELFVCWAAPHGDGVDRVLAGVPESLLRQLADLLNDAMGLRRA